jgi:hypothetical protein
MEIICFIYNNENKLFSSKHFEILNLSKRCTKNSVLLHSKHLAFLLLAISVDTV